MFWPGYGSAPARHPLDQCLRVAVLAVWGPTWCRPSAHSASWPSSPPPIPLPIGTATQSVGYGADRNLYAPGLDGAKQSAGVLRSRAGDRRRSRVMDGAGRTGRAVPPPPPASIRLLPSLAHSAPLSQTPRWFAGRRPLREPTERRRARQGEAHGRHWYNDFDINLAHLSSLASTNAVTTAPSRVVHILLAASC